jgi:hypothetical protein
VRQPSCRFSFSSLLLFRFFPDSPLLSPTLSLPYSPALALNSTRRSRVKNTFLRDISAPSASLRSPLSLRIFPHLRSTRQKLQTAGSLPSNFSNPGSPVFRFEPPLGPSKRLKFKRMSRGSIRTAGIQNTAKIATISTYTDKKLHFSCIFRAITLAFSCRVRYSPLGANFFARYSRVDEKVLQPARVSRDGKKSTGG